MPPSDASRRRESAPPERTRAQAARRANALLAQWTKAERGLDLALRRVGVLSDELHELDSQLHIELSASGGDVQAVSRARELAPTSICG